MHFCGYVIGPDVEGQLARYDENLAVAPRLGVCRWCDGDPRYVADCEECNGEGKATTTHNPDGQWDWYAIGGRWAGAIKVKPGRPGRLIQPEDGWSRPQREDWTDRYDMALAGDIDWAESRMPYFLVIEGVWRARERWDGSTFVPDPYYEMIYERTLPNLAPDTPVTVVDAHS